MKIKQERHAAYDAPNPEEFDRLYTATFDDSDDRVTQLENRFITVAGGRLTLRRAAMLHFNRDWLDTDRKLIKIPPHSPCDCSYCRTRAEEYAEGRDMSVTEALEYWWNPKTESGARSIYYGWSPMTIDAVEQFADYVGELDMDASTINRRVDTLADRAGIDRNIYPHALRASAALFFADLGLEAHYLQALMGWKSIEVAVAYLSVSGVKLAQRIERAFAIGDITRPDGVPKEDILPPADEAVKGAAEEEITPRPEEQTIQEWIDSRA